MDYYSNIKEGLEEVVGELGYFFDKGSLRGKGKTPLKRGRIKIIFRKLNKEVLIGIINLWA